MWVGDYAQGNQILRQLVLTPMPPTETLNQVLKAFAYAHATQERLFGQINIVSYAFAQITGEVRDSIFFVYEAEKSQE